MPFSPAFGRQMQADVSEFEASLIYKVSSRTARMATWRNPVLIKEPHPTKKKKLKN